jgi:hypothetical protein
MYSRPVQISRTHYSLFLDNRNQPLHRYHRLRHISLNVGTYGSKSRIKRPCEEKSVDWEKPENGWGTVGEQLLPNKADSARKPGFHPPQIVDSEQQALGRYSL